MPWPGIEPGSPALGVGSLNHWTTREVLYCSSLLKNKVVSGLPRMSNDKLVRSSVIFTMEDCGEKKSTLFGSFQICQIRAWILNKFCKWFLCTVRGNRGHPRWCSGKQSTCQWRRHKRRRGFEPWVRKIPWGRKWQPTLVFLSGESHGQRRLVGYSLWGHKELDTTEHAHMMRTTKGHWSTACNNGEITELLNKYNLLCIRWERGRLNNLQVVWLWTS